MHIPSEHHLTWGNTSFGGTSQPYDNISAIVRFARSTKPSDCGRKGQVLVLWIPRILHTSNIILEQKLVPRSVRNVVRGRWKLYKDEWSRFHRPKAICDDKGTPRTKCSINKSATVSASYPFCLKLSQGRSIWTYPKIGPPGSLYTSPGVKRSPSTPGTGILARRVAPKYAFLLHSCLQETFCTTHIAIQDWGILSVDTKN